MRQCNDYVFAAAPSPAAAAAPVSPAVYDVDCFAFPRLCLLPSALGQRPDPASAFTPLLSCSQALQLPLLLLLLPVALAVPFPIAI